MNKNMGNADRILRVLIAIVLIILSFTWFQSGVLSTILLVIAAVFIVTSIFGVCPLYSLFHLNSFRRSRGDNR